MAVGMNLFIPNAPDVFTPERVNEKTLEHHKTVLRELYQRDKNHPCVVMWSVTNFASLQIPRKITVDADNIKQLRDLVFLHIYTHNACNWTCIIK